MARKTTPNIIGPRLDQHMKDLGWGSELVLLARLHQMAGLPGMERLGTITQDQLSRLRHGGRPCYDWELLAVAIAAHVNPLWLLGVSDSKEAPADLPDFDQFLESK